MSKTILILILDHVGDLMPNNAMLRYLVMVWERQGFNVKIAQGVKEEVDADVVIAHIDLTVVPDEYSDFLKKYPIVINGRVNNISKSLISEIMLTRESDYDGPVIVKTDANYGGAPELLRDKKQGRLQNTGIFVGLWHRLQQAGIFKRPWRYVQYLDSHNYPRFNSIKDVPGGVWQNDNLIVEKFLPEIDEEGHYCIRRWCFLGDKDIGLYQTSTNPITKSAEFKNKIITDVPDELKVIRNRLEVDYGRFDYVMNDGKAVIFDLNTTPSIGNYGLDIIGEDGMVDLASGIEYYLNA
jgi:hypothetical protein